KVSRPRREIVAGSGPHLTDETRVLLRSRLRAAASMLLLGFGVFLVRHVVSVLSGEPLDPALLPNTWRRAALVIGAMALAPDLLVLGMVLAYPEVAALLTPMAMLQYVLVMLVAAVAAVF